MHFASKAHGQIPFAAPNHAGLADCALDEPGGPACFTVTGKPSGPAIPKTSVALPFCASAAVAPARSTHPRRTRTSGNGPPVAGRRNSGVSRTLQGSSARGAGLAPVEKLAFANIYAHSHPVLQLHHSPSATITILQSIYPASASLPSLVYPLDLQALCYSFTRPLTSSSSPSLPHSHLQHASTIPTSFAAPTLPRSSTFMSSTSSSKEGPQHSSTGCWQAHELDNSPLSLYTHTHTHTHTHTLCSCTSILAIINSLKAHSLYHLDLGADLPTVIHLTTPNYMACRYPPKTHAAELARIQQTTQDYP
ncbi:BgTH12-03820 [Blumeria graminis f. sp. triticale]|uniref:BgTH12-03820 n=1 Tax=Blumeria graminis f. sp. triticale TaxID=1689686 RepID=A0A9W4D0H9_BLUGR|nr:BgTH12-03820 [Blumeria graminis f. sp. triticale]